MDIDAELRVLETTLGVTICFHDLSGHIEPLVGSHRIQHRSAICVASKRHATAACTACDAHWCQQIVADHRLPFWKICHVGILECYVPIWGPDDQLGAAFIGQWWWKGHQIPDRLQLDPQPPQPPKRQVNLPILSDLDDIDRITVFATMLAARLEQAVTQAGRGLSDANRQDTITHWVAHRISQSIELADLAQSLGVSVSRAGHIVRESCATTFPRVVLQARLDKARNLLALSNLSIATIASRCGFHDHRYFHRCFKKAEGQSPDAWRQQRLQA